ncbi:head maturation protease, ClpP-related [Cytobacillus sp. IB215665]|uniref:head maturation protease, ClpP-related n=1 Tax=Cytobacillus sp. IB215665 TaxID=3097357 RepID=UPI002A1248F5|nr:head maturation protease, ClpP-related [Cytobacillus sp. IB215665]MDX8367774.1 Clp protease ClpP [Cytobacillus sp. IB215665]
MTQKQKKFWNMVKNEKKNSGEIKIYGEISDYNWWGDSITPKDFATDLADLGDVENIDVRINSGGGGVFAGLSIYNQLKRHSANITVFVDGLAASIASIIAMAGNKIVIPTGSFFMIHNPMSSVWGGDANELRETAELLDKIRDSLVDVYEARTSMNRDEIVEKMDNESWFGASEAVEFGLADEIEEAMSVTASMQGRMAIFNGVNIDLSRFTNAPKLPKQQANPSNEPQNIVQNTNNEVKKTVKNLEELKNEHPDIYNQAIQAGAEQERGRIEALDKVKDSNPGNDEIINKAKYETFNTAEQAALDILNAQSAKRNDYLNNVKNDAQNSGINNVTPQEPHNQKTVNEEAKEKGSAIANFINKNRG